MNDRKLPIEDWLSQMHFREPTSELDAAVQKTLDSPDKIDVLASSRFGWAALATTAAVCTAAGLLLGWLLFRTPAINSVLSEKIAKQQDHESREAESRVAVRESASSPLHGHEARIVGQEFVIEPGVGPSRVYEVQRSRVRDQQTGPAVRSRIILPSPEI